MLSSYSKNLLKFSLNLGNWKICGRTCIAKSTNNEDDQQFSSPYMQFCGDWPQEELLSFVKDMRIIPHFVSEDEEARIIDEIDPYMKRLRYESDHWDDAIQGYRETERKTWYPHNRAVLDRLCAVGFASTVMPYVHILDLSKEGVIKPHVDSVRYCGDTICGISLLSDCVMRLVRTDESKYNQPVPGEEPIESNKSQKLTDTNYRAQPQAEDNKNKFDLKFYADLLLPRRSLYIMSNSSRYNFTHEILANDISRFRGERIDKQRRISIICRSEPTALRLEKKK